MVSPAEVRLHPVVCDLYRWQYHECYARIFEKNLSDLSTKDYIEIREAVRDGHIWATRPLDELTPNEPSQNPTDRNLIEQLAKVEEERNYLRNENDRLKSLLRHHIKQSQTMAYSAAVIMKRLESTWNGDHKIE
jgi:hypothetical protein